MIERRDREGGGDGAALAVGGALGGLLSFGAASVAASGASDEIGFGGFVGWATDTEEGTNATAREADFTGAGLEDFAAASCAD